MPKIKKPPELYTLQEVTELLAEVDKIIEFYCSIIEKANKTPVATNLENVLNEAISIASAKKELDRIRKIKE